MPLVIAYVLLGATPKECGTFFVHHFDLQVGHEISLYEKTDGVVVSLSYYAAVPGINGEYSALIMISEGDKDNAEMVTLKEGEKTYIDKNCSGLIKLVKVSRDSHIAKFIMTQ